MGNLIIRGKGWLKKKPEERIIGITKRGNSFRGYFYDGQKQVHARSCDTYKKAFTEAQKKLKAHFEKTID